MKAKNVLLIILIILGIYGLIFIVLCGFNCQGNCYVNPFEFDPCMGLRFNLLMCYADCITWVEINEAFCESDGTAVIMMRNFEREEISPTTYFNISDDEFNAVSFEWKSADGGEILSLIPAYDHFRFESPCGIGNNCTYRFEYRGRVMKPTVHC